jgi:hypothetical protein
LNKTELADRFYERYAGLPRAYGTYILTHVDGEKGKQQGKASTQIGLYTSHLWRMHLDGRQGLGVIPINDDAMVSWGCIDIDIYPLNLEELDLKVKKFNLPLVTIRTKSGGAHLTLFMREPASAAIVRSKLTEFSLALGYGGVEIYPKQIRLASLNDVGNWLNMPYFGGDGTTRYALKNGSVLNCQQFLEYAEERAVTSEELLGVKIDLSDYFDDGPPCLQVLATNGIPEGSRNNTLFAIGVYTRMKYPDDWEARLDALNVEIMTPALASREVQLVTRSLNKKTYYYPCTKAPICNVCNKDLCKKRQYGVGDSAGTEFDISVGSLIKIMTDPPTWIIDIEGVRMELETEDLLSQERFRRLCVSAVNKLPSRLKALSWEKLIRDKLNAVEMLEAPQESSLKGRLHFYAEQFLVNTPQANNRDELLLGKPWTESAVTYFRGNDFIRYLEVQGMRVDPREIWSALRSMGAGHTQFNLKKRNVQVWKIDFSAYQNENFDQPEMPKAPF